MPNDYKLNCDDLEDKRREFSKFAFELYKREGTLSGKALLRESYALDEVVNKRQLEERLSQYQRSVGAIEINPSGKIIN